MQTEAIKPLVPCERDEEEIWLKCPSCGKMVEAHCFPRPGIYKCGKCLNKYIFEGEKE